MAKLSADEVTRAVAGLPGWSVKGDALVKTYKHSSFAEAIVFVNAVAHMAELADHHPDVDIRYSTILVALRTHDQGGITEKDVTLARDIDEIRRKAGVPA